MSRISVLVDGTPIDYKSFVFSGGEIQVRLLNDKVQSDVEITIIADLRNASDIIELLLLTDAVKRAFGRPVDTLLCRYFPYARQDRVCSPGEANSLHVMMELINQQAYGAVIVWDFHNPKLLDKLNQSINVIPSQLMRMKDIDVGDSVFVSPDKGAIGRVNDCVFEFGNLMIIAEKVRNPENGQILATKIPDDVNRLNTDDGFFIVDDICDGGRTFVELAKVLRPHTTGKIRLWVTHGIFSQGFDVFKGLIDEIYTPNCWHEVVPDFVHIV